MTVEVTPTTFRFVEFDAAEIRDLVETLVIDLAIDRDVHISIDETTPLARIRIEIDAQITIHVDSGALEDTRRPRRFGRDVAIGTLGRALLRARDRADSGFAEAPDDEHLSLAQIAAWDTYCAGRLARHGRQTNRQRWLYDFRNRHGFTDLADETFETLWSADSLTWRQLDDLSTTALHAEHD